MFMYILTSIGMQTEVYEYVDMYVCRDTFINVYINMYASMYGGKYPFYVHKQTGKYIHVFVS